MEQSAKEVSERERTGERTGEREEKRRSRVPGKRREGPEDDVMMAQMEARNYTSTW